MKAALRFSLAIICVLLQATCIRRPTLYEDDQEVIATVVKQLCSQKIAGYSVLSPSTAKVSSAFTPTGIDDSARRSLLSRNATSVALSTAVECDSLKLLDQKELDSYFGTANNSHLDGYEQWVAFYKRFEQATGVMSLSLPGYSTDGTLAIVQVAGACGVTCGGGSFWVLRRMSGHWRVDKSIQGWQS